MKKVQLLLMEYDIPENPLPTRGVCDLVDIVRRDACALLGLQTTLLRKEKEVWFFFFSFYLSIFYRYELFESLESYYIT